MQADHYPLSQFYIDWLVAIQEVSMLKGNPFSNALVSTCTNRLERLRNNMAFKASLYLDPRLNFLDSTVFETTNEKAEIQNFIADTWKRIRSLSPVVSSDEKEHTNAFDFNDKVDDILTKMFGGTFNTSSDNSSTFYNRIRALDTQDRQPHTFNVWKHWVARKYTHPELHSVAMVVLATPSSQVSVERALAIILSDQRTGLGAETLSNILLVKLNKDLSDKVMSDLYIWNDTITEMNSNN
ncbi:uncharacterized protein LOC129770502 [Toxorhynchites rutilus septentrionalis]|uniref:uncharacterized protein LOC129770502 n=1 Tax=Toxorhynchites rutilus septentrionalis TaxID=329112 RepID=UPI00247A8E51|nr:uncharacterized protein LOC129770502 [Toxorhynchites rutilus septentrionalis]